ncbi:MAG: deoxyribonuclease V [Chloroflexi bacterium]|nr:deoxyribonuclease V [Chloroflexota bacterium]
MALLLHHAHAWDVTPAQAVALQRTLAPLVREEPLVQTPRTIAGVDMSVREDQVQAAVVVLSFPDLLLIEQAIWRGPVEFPYVPGLLSFREAPAVLRALEQLQVQPDVLMTDSQGRAHPRRFGLACHLGVLLDRPVWGVAKSKLTGVHAELPAEPGGQVPLYSGKEEIGAVLRTRVRTNPLYVSVGHRITLPEAVALTFACAKGYRLPEPTRQAHLLSKKQNEQSG